MSSTSNQATASLESEAETETSVDCSICYKTCQLDGVGSDVAVFEFCGKACPLVLCKNCVSAEVATAVIKGLSEFVFYFQERLGALPTVKCPTCEKGVPKAKWASHVDPLLLKGYEEACHKACAFRSPCCGNEGYTHLPYAWNATDVPAGYVHPAKLMLVPSLKKELGPLLQLTRQFVNHKIYAEQLMRYIEDVFWDHVPFETQHLIVEHLLPRIEDEERRAMFLLTYFIKYRAITTRCCGLKICMACVKPIEKSDDCRRCRGGQIITKTKL